MTEQPGAPPEPTEPMDNNGEKPIFSFEELQLLHSVVVDDTPYLIFDVSGEFIIQVKKWEYFSYLDMIFTLAAKAAAEGKACTCNHCEPDYVILEGESLITSIEVKEDGTTKESSKPIPFYECFNLAECTDYSIHDNEEEQIEIKKD